MIQLTQGGVMKYPRTIDQAIAVVGKAKLLSTVLAELSAEDETLAGLIAAAEAKIATLNGTGDGSVDKKISDAIDAFANEVTENGTIDTVKELMNYVAEHGAEFSAVLERLTTAEGKITTLEGKVEALEGDNTTNKANIASNTEAINSLNTKVGSSADEADAEGSLYARLKQVIADLSALSGDGGTVSEQISAAIDKYDEETVQPIAEDVAAIKADYLTSADKTELQGNIDAANEAAAAADAKGAQGISDAAAALARANEAYTLAEGKIGYTVVSETSYPDFSEIISNEEA